MNFTKTYFQSGIFPFPKLVPDSFREEARGDYVWGGSRTAPNVVTGVATLRLSFGVATFLIPC
jgi:hypothetical protein